MTYSWRAALTTGMRSARGEGEGWASHRGHLKTILTCCTARYAQPEAPPVKQERCIKSLQQHSQLGEDSAPWGPVNAEASGRACI